MGTTRSHAFAAALAVSVLFHLSMVSVFSIVIRFPGQDMSYIPLDIIQQAVERVRQSGPRPSLRAPSPTEFLDEQGQNVTATAGTPEPWDALPEVELPRFQLSVSDTLRTHEDSLRIRSQFSDVFEQKTQEGPDSWAAFTNELRGIGPTLSRLTSPTEPEEEKVVRKISTPVPGVGVYIEWISEPKQRKVLLAPPMPALLNIDAGRLTEPIEVSFTVNSQGRVTDAQVPAVGDNAAAAEGVRDALRSYVFEPLAGDQAREQRGTLIVKAEAPEP